jgi:hypothetical protein
VDGPTSGPGEGIVRRHVVRPHHVLFLALVLTGCPSGKSAPPSSTSQVPTFGDEKSILLADATTAPVQSALVSLGEDRSKRLSLRTTALKKLQEQAPHAAVLLADALVESTFRSSDDETLRKDSVQVLVQIGTPEAQDALDRGKKNNLDVGILAARLTPTGGK